MNWIPATPIQSDRLKALYYNDKLFVGRDKLWGAYHAKHKDHPISQRSVLDWLKKQEVWQTFTRPIKRGSIRPVVHSKAGYLSLDSIVMPNYNGFTNAYTLVDTFTKMFYAKESKTIEANDTIKFFDWLKENFPNQQISVIQSDNGGSFKEPFKTWCANNDIKLTYSKPHSPWSNPVERQNGTFKRMIFQAMTAGDTRDWVSLLPRIVANMNSTINFATKHVPLEVSRNNEVHENVFGNIQRRANKRYKVKASNLNDIQVGDSVRKVIPYTGSGIVRYSKTGYFAPEVFEVVRVIPAKYANMLPSFKLKTQDGRVLDGQWARWQLLKVPKDTVRAAQPDVNPPPDQHGKWEVESIIGKRVDRQGNIYYKTKWIGYKRATWESAEILEEDVPDLVREYEEAHR